MDCAEKRWKALHDIPDWTHRVIGAGRIPSVPCSDPGVKTLYSETVCLSQLLVSACLQHPILQESLRATENIDERAICFGHLYNSFCLALLPVKSGVCLFALAII